MPHVSSGSGGDDLGSTDEVKVFKDEGEDEKRSSENLTEEKSSLIDLTESEVCYSFVYVCPYHLSTMLKASLSLDQTDNPSLYPDNTDVNSSPVTLSF